MSSFYLPLHHFMFIHHYCVLQQKCLWRPSLFLKKLSGEPTVETQDFECLYSKFRGMPEGPLLLPPLGAQRRDRVVLFVPGLKWHQNSSPSWSHEMGPSDLLVKIAGACKTVWSLSVLFAWKTLFELQNHSSSLESERVGRDRWIVVPGHTGIWPGCSFPLLPTPPYILNIFGASLHLTVLKLLYQI